MKPYPKIFYSFHLLLLLSTTYKSIPEMHRYFSRESILLKPSMPKIDFRFASTDVQFDLKQFSMNFWAKINSTSVLRYFSMSFDDIERVTAVSDPSFSMSIIWPTISSPIKIRHKQDSNVAGWALISLKFTLNSTTLSFEITIDNKGFVGSFFTTLPFDSVTFSFCDQDTASDFCKM